MLNLTKLPTRLLLAIAVLAGCIGCDQATKHIATRALRGEGTHSYLADTVRLKYVQNPGGFLSLGSGLSEGERFALFIVFNAVFLGLVVVMLLARRQMSTARFLVLLLLLGGGIGNMIDRVTQGGLVTDFLNLGIGPVRTGIFNVADMAVFFGAIAMLIVFRKEEPEHREDS